MTIATRIVIVDPTPHLPLWEKLLELVGSDGEYQYTTQPESSPYGPHRLYETFEDRGALSWLQMRMAIDAPIRLDDDETNTMNPLWFGIEASNFWSGHSYCITLTNTCTEAIPDPADCHAWIVAQLAEWMPAGVRWVFHEEHFDQWWGPEHIAELGDPERFRSRCPH